MPYRRLNQSKRKQSQVVVAHTFNPSPRELEMVCDVAGRREEYNVGALNISSGLRLRLCRRKN